MSSKKSEKVGDQRKFLDDTLTRAEELCEKLNTSRSGHIAMPRRNVTAHRHRLQQAEIDDELMQSFHEPEPVMWFNKTPEYIVAGAMRDYQLQGLNWLISLYENGINGILADEMGLGKTLQSIALLGYLQKYKNIDGPHLVITPKTALQNWTDELQRWCPSLDVVCMIGNADARNATFRKLKHTKKYVLITSFEMCTIEAYRLSSISWCYIITDEGHRLKNEKTRLATVLRTITCKHRLLLTGSPLNNNIRELWALLNYLMPQIFDCSITFDAIFDMNDWNEDKKTFKRLLNIINALLLRREKADVERSLLPKIMTTVYADITPMQMELYQQIIRKEIHVINGTGQVKKQKLQNIVMNLRKCTNHPYLFDGIEPEPFVEGDHLINNCGKMVVLDNLLTKLKANGSRVLVFSQMTSMLDILEDYCEWRGFDYCRLDGKTSHQQRGQYTAEYNAPKSKKFIFLLSTRAGGLSINLTSADAVVIYDSDWNPQMDLQAMDRAHRIGQKKQVKVFRLITKNSIDERIAQLAEEKLRLGKLIDIKSSRKAALSLEQMLDMIRQNADYVLDEKENIRSSSRSNEPESITKQRKFSASNPLINSTMECVKRR